jgi:type IV fimbrial biogenesis protein FimT
MLKPRYMQRGFSLVELMVGIVIVGLLLSLAIPMFRSMVQNSQIRTTAEVIQNGLQLARAEAVRRNQQTRFQLTSTTDAACVLSTTSSNWVVSINGLAGGDPTGSCGSAPSETVAPYIIQTRSSKEGSKNVVIATNLPVIAFNGLGRQVSVTNLDATVTTPTAAIFEVPDSTSVSCTTLRCMQVQVSLTGQIRMCDPALASTDPQGC